MTTDLQWRHAVARHTIDGVLVDFKDEAINRQEALMRIVEMCRWEYREALDVLKDV